METILLEDLMLKKGESVNPSKYLDETFELYSIPAYDSNTPEILLGSEIGSSKKKLRPKDVIISRIVPHIRRCWVIPESNGYRKIGSGEWIVFRSENVVPNFLRYYLLSDMFNSMFMKTVKGIGGSLLRADPKQVAKFKLNLPPLPIQKKIAAILDAADAYRQKTKALIKKYDELLDSIVYQCLGEALNRDIKNIKSGSNEFLEDGFTWHTLDEITEAVADIDHKMPKSVNKGKIFLSAKDLSDNGELDFSNPKFISEDDFRHLSRKIKPKKFDIIYSRIGAKLGKARLVKTDHDFIVSYSCCTIRPKQDIVSPLYLKYILDSETTLRQASHGTRGIGVPDLGMGEIRAFKIPIPEKNISQKIVNQLENIEIQKTKAEASLEKGEDLFNSLLQRAFKGELA